MPVGLVKANSLYYVHTDHLGTPRVITNNANTVVWKWNNVDPFGGNLPTTQTIVYNKRFPGQYFDNESKLHYNYYRTYNPLTGRYIQSDPLGLAAGFNTYSYVGSNPLGKVDPLGLSKSGEPVELNLFAKSTHFYTASLNLTHPKSIDKLFPDIFTVAGHMSHLQIDDNRLCNANKNDGMCALLPARTMYLSNSTNNVDNFIDLINKSNYKKGMSIFLAGCHSGENEKDANAFARVLSKKLNVPVVGVIHWAMFKNDNTLGFFNTGKVYGTDDNSTSYISTNNGQPKYRVFYPNGTFKNLN